MHEPHVRLNRETSVYLDVVRLAAALVVMFGHLAGARFTGGFLWPLGAVMDDAVTIFFVLSGFVIGHATMGRPVSAREYMVARAARIFSVALPALVLTFALDAAGRELRPDLYTHAWGYVADGRLWQFTCGVLFANQLWWLNVPPGSDLPYWSLGYEVWYYVLFGLVMFTPGRRRWPLVVGGLLLVGPKIAVLFPLWLLGLAANRICAGVVFRRDVGWLLCVCGPLAGVGLLLVLRGMGPITVGGPDLMRSYVLGIAFAAHIIGFRAISASFGWALLPFTGAIRWTAGATFTIYLMHLPVAQFLIAVLPSPALTMGARLALLGLTLAVLYLLAEVTERRKRVWARGIGALVGTARAAKQQQIV